MLNLFPPDCYVSGKKIIIKNVKNFDLNQTFDCGQCFRFEKTDNKFTGIVKNKYIELSQTENEIILNNVNIEDFKNFWVDFFDLTTDYSKIKNNLSTLHPILEKACCECGGIRILRQEPWEVLCSFIISQNNNIPRIKKIIRSLCTFFGEKTASGFSFPTAQKISVLSTSDLNPIRAGFRAKYIIDAAKKISNGTVNFNEIKKSSYSIAKKSLTEIYGVGPKVADCVLLYGFHKFEAFPMDIWMKKIMNKFFKYKTPNFFGKFAGVAQQYLYHYVRLHPEILEENI